MPDPEVLRSLARQLENPAFPLIRLQAVRALRAKLDEIEVESMLGARELGASVIQIADQLGVTRQAVYLKLKRLDEMRARETSPPEA